MTLKKREFTAESGNVDTYAVRKLIIHKPLINSSYTNLEALTLAPIQLFKSWLIYIMSPVH